MLNSFSFSAERGFLIIDIHMILLIDSCPFIQKVVFNIEGFPVKNISVIIIYLVNTIAAPK